MKSQTRLQIVATMLIAGMTFLAMWLVAEFPSTSGTSPDRPLRVGFAIERPYAYIDRNGHVTGEAPELFRVIAQRLGHDSIDWVRMEFAQLLPELEVGRIDAIAAGMFITPERQQRASFTRATARVRPALVVRRDESRLPTTPALQDLAQATDLRWSVLQGAVEFDMLTAAGIEPPSISTTTSALRGIRTVADGDADVMALSTVTAWQLVNEHEEWSLEVRPLRDGPVGEPAFAFRLRDSSLRNAFDAELSRFIGTEEHIALTEPFGFGRSELPAQRRSAP